MRAYLPFPCGLRKWLKPTPTRRKRCRGARFTRSRSDKTDHGLHFCRQYIVLKCILGGAGLRGRGLFFRTLPCRARIPAGKKILAHQFSSRDTLAAPLGSCEDQICEDQIHAPRSSPSVFRMKSAHARFDQERCYSGGAETSVSKRICRS